MDRTSYIVVGLCSLLLIGWYLFMGTPAPPADDPALPSAPEPRLEPEVWPEPAIQPALVEDLSTLETGLAEDFPRGAESKPVDQVWIRDRGKIRLNLDGERGGIVRTVLEEYVQYPVDGDKHAPLVELGNWRFPLASLIIPTAVEQRRVLEKDTAGMTLESRLENGLTVVEEWRFAGDREYLLDYSVYLRNLSGETRELTDLIVAGGGLQPDRTGDGGPRMQRMGMMDLGIDFLPAGDRHPVRFDIGDIQDLSRAERAELARVEAEWWAVHNKYFLFFIRPIDSLVSGLAMGHAELNDGSYGHSASSEPEDWIYGALRLPQLHLAAGESREFKFQVYAGPKEFHRIRELGPGMSSVLGMDFFFFGRARWMGTLSTVILRSLLALREAGLSFGLAIIVVTVVIKIIFWPLTHKSAVSMRRMQKLQPLVKELREKHKAEPQVMNQKVMALYREHKANPLGGCLPMLCQIPVFLALFNTLRSAIELRQSSFLWVVDLSQPDTLGFMPFGLPIRPLALLMGGSMMLQQKMTPTSADPAQARMMMFMSVFFIFIFYSMPAGLTLYWTINQLLTIVQHAMLRKMDK